MKLFYTIDAISEAGDVTHLPLLYRRRGEAEKAAGAMARSNGAACYAVVQTTWEVSCHARIDRVSAGSNH
jgi:hypothetical protein